jgi:ATP/maltotriose-dependent transcriptional regulator MalT
VSGGEVDRRDVSLAISTLLAEAVTAPAALVLEGEAGIGKTTTWLGAVELARERGFRVLSTRPAAAESVMGHAALADLLDSVDPSTWAGLPAPQRQAIDQTTLRAADTGTGREVTDRAVAAGFSAVVARLAQDSPVLIAIDDLQWLDSSSARVLGSVTRRLTGPVGLLGALRTSADDSATVAWLQPPRPDQLCRITLQPLTIGALHAVIVARLGRSLPRPELLRIHQTSGGNPFYAVELARSLHDRPDRESLPRSLAELVDQRIDSVDPTTESALLASSCLPAPTVDVVARATDADPAALVDLLEPAERHGIVVLDGIHIRFAHPLMSRGVYLRASPARRRAMHRRLAELVDEPEPRARHLALAATTGDPATLAALDTAADIARRRGAPEAATELVALALRLGGDTPERRIQLAGLHFNTGDSERARHLLEQTVAEIGPGELRANALYLLAMVRMFDDSFVEAAAVLERGLTEAAQVPALRVQMLITLSFARFNAGKLDAAIASMREATSEAEHCGSANMLSQALNLRVMLHFIRGDGVDMASLQRAMELEDRQAAVPSAFSASVQHGLVLACTGDLATAHQRLQVVRDRYIERGDESELVFIDFHLVLTEIWRGAFAEAAVVAHDLMERAVQSGGDLPMLVALTARAALAAYTGDADQCRGDAMAALAAARRTDSSLLSQWPVTILGFLDVSLGQHAAALTTLQSQTARLADAPDGTEIITAAFLPDAVEAMVAVGQLDEAERWAKLLEHNATRLDRPWMSAVGGRCLSMVSAARGDVDAAVRCAEQAMAEHDRVPMPFERARTQLLLGQLLRRSRQRDAAARTLDAALDAFVELGTPLWATRARIELERLTVGRRGGMSLTPSERRVAELAGAGMTNRDIAATLFISPKTVETNLSRIYRKLGIRSRAELGAAMSSGS